MLNIFTTHSMHGATVHELVQPAPGVFYTRVLDFLPGRELSPEERAAWAEADRGPGDSAYDQPADLFTTEAAARRAAELHECIANILDDIAVFGAPSECIAPACRTTAAELLALYSQFSVQPASAVLN